MNAMNLATTMVDQRGKWAHQAANFPLKPLRSFRPPSKIGQYELLEPLGSGATSEVHLAIAPDMTAVALKMVPKDIPDWTTGKKLREILHQESQILTKLDHPAIPSLHDSDKDEGFLALQLVFGKTVEQMMDEASGSTFPADTVLKIMKGVLEGLEHAHEKGIVHRDIKPGNVMISDRGDVYITDWGLGMEKSSERNGSGDISGTPIYMSPEQVRGLPVDERSDLFSLGAMSFELFFGFNPFSRDTMAATLKAVMSDPVPVEVEPIGLDELEGSVFSRIFNALGLSFDGSGASHKPDPLKSVIYKLLEKAPEARYQSASEVLAALSDIK